MKFKFYKSAEDIADDMEKKFKSHVYNKRNKNTLVPGVFENPCSDAAIDSFNNSVSSDFEGAVCESIGDDRGRLIDVYAISSDICGRYPDISEDDALVCAVYYSLVDHKYRSDLREMDRSAIIRKINMAKSGNYQDYSKVIFWTVMVKLFKGLSYKLNADNYSRNSGTYTTFAPRVSGMSKSEANNLCAQVRDFVKSVFGDVHISVAALDKRDTGDITFSIKIGDRR